MKLLRHGFFNFSHQKLPFSILHRNPQENYPLHEHEFVELVIVTGGKGCHFTDRISYTLERGDVFIVRPGQKHGYRDVDGLTLINVLYNTESLMTSLADIGTMAGFHALFKIEPHFASTSNTRLLLTDDEINESVAILSKIEREIENNAAGFVFFSKIYFLELVGYLSRCYNVDDPKNSVEVARVAEAISFIEQHYTEDIDQNKLAQTANLSKSHFLNIFKKTTKTTPLLYQKLLRMEKACSLLTQSDMSISNISYNCGYNDSNYFTRQFKSVMKVSPKKYRENNINIEISDTP